MILLTHPQIIFSIIQSHHQKTKIRYKIPLDGAKDPKLADHEDPITRSGTLRILSAMYRY